MNQKVFSLGRLKKQIYSFFWGGVNLQTKTWGDRFMKYFFLILIVVFSSSVSAVSVELDSQISKLEFQGVHFGDFPSVEMICIRGLCPVGEEGVGIKTHSLIPPTYNQRTAITHYHGVKITTPAFSYFDDKMFQVSFRIDCDTQGQQECIAAVMAGLDAEYGLQALESSDDERMVSRKSVDFMADSGSLVLISWDTDERVKFLPIVKIFDESLINLARKSLNPNYVPFKIPVPASRQVEKVQEPD